MEKNSKNCGWFMKKNVENKSIFFFLNLIELCFKKLDMFCVWVRVLWIFFVKYFFN